VELYLPHPLPILAGGARDVRRRRRLRRVDREDPIGQAHPPRLWDPLPYPIL